MEDSFLMEPWVTWVGVAVIAAAAVWWFKFRPES